jgi:hypothetical protein
MMLLIALFCAQVYGVPVGSSRGHMCGTWIKLMGAHDAQVPLLVL